ncbi:Arf guanine nucleotide exchange factor gea1 [Saccharomyces pastorianus]|uniref:Arf guanine nucleotide exchange factor gea1 n=1 Tax=Saccharomyces pastorianus TaxID=27292 RepID=A0A6C1DV44_SACPS|nr:Arf guanine nucleotide exchange factor gea1 [Saccharomyces pastorianus]
MNDRTIESVLAVDPATMIIKECINLCSAMKKQSRDKSRTSVTALLGGGSDMFINQSESFVDSFHNLANSEHHDPLISGLVELRLKINNLKGSDEINALELLDPFLQIVSASSVSGYITSLALDSLQKLFTLNVINKASMNIQSAIRETVVTLTHCKFETSKQSSDDSVLLKVVILLRYIVISSFGDYLSDAIIYDVLQTTLSLACNTQRSEVLRKTAEITIARITVKLFTKLKLLEPPTKTEKYINDESYTNNDLKDDVIGTTGSDDELISTDDDNATDNHKNKDLIDPLTKHQDKDAQKGKKDDEIEPNYGISVIKDYLGLLLSLIMPENRMKHTTSAMKLSLQLINTAIEISGDKFPLYPRSFNLISDPIFKSIVYLLQNSTQHSLLQATLQLFTSLVVILGDYLPMQIELTLRRIFEILEDKKGADDATKQKSPALKELIIEQLSILWIHSPTFFLQMFVNFDCNLDRSDLSIDFIKALTRFSLPAAAITTSNNVPPICLEGIVSLIDNIYNDLQKMDKKDFVKNEKEIETLRQRDRKTEFIMCVESFNEKAKKGVPMLIEKGFIESDSDEDIASFLFLNNGRLNKKTIGLLLCDPKKTSLLKKFIDLFDFKGLRVDEAIRILLTKFRLPGESQQIERIIEAFSSKYSGDQNIDEIEVGEGHFESNITSVAEDVTIPVQPDADSVFVLSYSIIMLNTDFHNPQVKEHMSFEDYSNNLRGCYNGKDFPRWYLQKIYTSIKVKEIVMPEEHHGNDKWFEDAWNNLISSASVMTEIQEGFKNPISKLVQTELIQYEKAFFSNVGEIITKTLFSIFTIASNDQISSRILETISRCTFINSYFSLDQSFNDIILRLGEMTTLACTNTKEQPSDAESIPLVEIFVEDTESKISVSSQSIKLGETFKGQLCTVTYFQIIRGISDPTVISSELWTQVVQIILRLFENLMMDLNLKFFENFHTLLKLPELPSPEPDVAIRKAKMSRSLLSTFASYLKGDEEPSEEDIDFSIKALECVKASRAFSSVFEHSQIITPQLVEILLSSLVVDKTNENSQYFEQELLLLLEISIILVSEVCYGKDFGPLIADHVVNISNLDGLSKESIARCASYKMFLVSKLNNPQNILIDLIKHDFLVKNEIFNAKYYESELGKQLLCDLFTHFEMLKYDQEILKDVKFWKFVRKLMSNEGNRLIVYQFVEKYIQNGEVFLGDGNFMHILGLLDEMSCAGAIGSKWEQNSGGSVEDGGQPPKSSPYRSVVDISSRSINITADLLSNSKGRDYTLSKTEIIAAIQGLAHQCLNPCNELGMQALQALERLLLSPTNKLRMGEVALDTLIETGLLPIFELDEIQNVKMERITDILSVISKIFLHELAKGNTNNETFLRVLNVFNEYVDDPTVERQLQQLIISKREIQNEDTGADVTLQKNTEK